MRKVVKGLVCSLEVDDRGMFEDLVALGSSNAQGFNGSGAPSGALKAKPASKGSKMS